MKTRERFLVALAMVVACDDSTQYSQRTYVKAPAPELRANLGHSVAIAGRITLVGAPYGSAGRGGVNPAPSNDRVAYAGHVMVVGRQASGTQRIVGRLEAENPQEGAHFGYDVAVDSDVLVIGAPYEDHSGLRDAGAVYVFYYNVDLDLWRYHQRITAVSPAASAKFGSSVAVSQFRIVVGSPQEDRLSTDASGNPYLFYDAGLARVYELRSGSYREVAVLAPPSIEDTDYFGFDVAIDGNRIAVGAPTGNTHSVDVYERGETTWSRVARITHQDNWFGESVDLSGSLLVVGAPYAPVAVDGVTYRAAGAVHVFRRSRFGGFASEGRITAQNAAEDHHFGSSVAIDGNLLAVGAPGDGSYGEHYGMVREDEAPNSGAVYTFWRTVTEPVVDPGLSVATARTALSTSATTTGVASPTATSSDPHQNRVVVASSSGDFAAIRIEWELLYMLKAKPPYAGELYGVAVGLSGDRIAIGAPGDSSAGVGVGASREPRTLASSGALHIVRRTP